MLSAYEKYKLESDNMELEYNTKGGAGDESSKPQRKGQVTQPAPIPPPLPLSPADIKMKQTSQPSLHSADTEQTEKNKRGSLKSSTTHPIPDFLTQPAPILPQHILPSSSSVPPDIKMKQTSQPSSHSADTEQTEKNKRASWKSSITQQLPSFLTQTQAQIQEQQEQQEHQQEVIESQASSSKYSNNKINTIIGYLQYNHEINIRDDSELILIWLNAKSPDYNLNIDILLDEALDKINTNQYVADEPFILALTENRYIILKEIECWNKDNDIMLLHKTNDYNDIKRILQNNQKMMTNCKQRIFDHANTWYTKYYTPLNTYNLAIH